MCKRLQYDYCMTLSTKRVQQIIEAASTFSSMREAANSIDMPFTTFKANAIQHGVYKKNQGSRGKVSKRRLTPAEVFSSTQPRVGRYKLNRALKEIGREYRCSECSNQGEWLERELVLHIDHINGISTDNRECNLRYLCPNCHSQTSTFGMKGRKHSAATRLKLSQHNRIHKSMHT